MQLTKVILRRFKQFKDAEVVLRDGVSIVAGGNNAGKSSLLQALAVWEFCKIATIAQKGQAALLIGKASNQGFGLGDDEFSPVNLPSLKHLWTNLKTQKAENDQDGYTLRIGSEWVDGDETHVLVFSLALANDRLFIKVSETTVREDTVIPVIAYLPPFAGISAREERTYGAVRRRRIGEGLAGAVLRNLLLDMREQNAVQRRTLRGGKSKISDPDLKVLRETDPWELLQQTLRDVFSAELAIADFNEEYHTYIQASVVKGAVDGYQLTRHNGYNAKDLMVEGSGFLQWLSVYTLATSPQVDVLLFDEPDAHLHAALQAQLVDRLDGLAGQFKKQVLLATHSSEILRSREPSGILEVRANGNFRYLSGEEQKVGLVVGIGSVYAPRIEKVRDLKKVFFFEGSSDLDVLNLIGKTAGIMPPTSIAFWQTPDSHKERKVLWRALSTEFGDVNAFSLRDRDDEPPATVGSNLEDKTSPDLALFAARKWRRRYMECYLIWPASLARASGRTETEVKQILRDEFALSIGPNYREVVVPAALCDVRAKEILTRLKLTPTAVAESIQLEEVCADVMNVLHQLQDFGAP